MAIQPLRGFLSKLFTLGLLLALFAPAGGAADEIKRGGTLVYVLGGAPQSLNMSLSVVHFDAVAASPMMEGLIQGGTSHRENSARVG